MAPPTNKLTQARITKYEQESRQEQICSLRLRGLTFVNIAKVLGISISTVQKDFKAIQKINAKRIDGLEQAEFIGESLAHYEEIEKKAWSEYHGAKKTQEKIKALDLIRVIQGDKIKALKEVGLIRGAEVKQVDVTHHHQLDWSVETQQRVAKAMLQASLTHQLAEPVAESEIIDVSVNDAEDACVNVEKEKSE